MLSNPRGDTVSAGAAGTGWNTVLSHRLAGDGSREAAAARFTAARIGPAEVRAALSDGGDALYAAARQGSPGWAAQFGGSLAVALLSAEISVFAAHLNSRASGIRSEAVAELLDDYSAVTVAAGLGVSRQKVYEISRGGLRPPYIDTVPWRTP
ncbi:hypothetical protein [Pseudarthrobacter sp. DSP2-3-2b1]|uniref:hypothetical protein n=1 Tax=Pseudarthrobacter sp. DSP2-3-2b1 TaxID=2804661 RepID=UPI003CF94565